MEHEIRIKTKKLQGNERELTCEINGRSDELKCALLKSFEGNSNLLEITKSALRAYYGNKENEAVTVWIDAHKKEDEVDTAIVGSRGDLMAVIGSILIQRPDILELFKQTIEAVDLFDGTQDLQDLLRNLNIDTNE